MKVCLRMEDISKRFGGIQALNKVNFDLKEGEVHALLGENGAGKSTLIKVLSGVHLPDSGRVMLNGKQVFIDNTTEAYKYGISTIFQELNMVPYMSVAENMVLGREPVRRFGGIVDRKARHKRCKDILDILNLNISLEAKVKDLSAGVQQMIEIGRALLIDAKILIMDEPTASLSEAEIVSLFRLVRDLKKKGISIIYISHRLEEVIELCDRATILRNGCLSGVLDKCDITIDNIIKRMVGHNVSNRYPKEINEVGQPVLEVKSLSLISEFSNINFTVNRGEVLGIAGLVGSKRSELAQSIFGAISYDEGEIIMENVKLPKGNIGKAIDAGIAFIPEERKIQGLIMGLSIKKNVSLPFLELITKNGIVNRKVETGIVENMKERLSIKAETIDVDVQNLSGGNQQKVVLAKWLNSSPKLVILDEPTRGIDVGAKIEVYNLINKLTADGVAVIMISSELPEVMGMSDRILVMCKGKMTGLFDRGDASEEKVLNCSFDTKGEMFKSEYN